jgi:hypothetical protein
VDPAVPATPLQTEGRTTVEPPESLPAQLYLLAYDPRKQRLVTRNQFSYLMRAAALTELLLRGRIADESGKVRAVEGGKLADPVLGDLLGQIAESRPRSWQHWIHKDHRATARAVRDEMESGRWIRVELRRPFLIFSRTFVVVRDTRVVKRISSRVSTALTGPLSRVDTRDAALVALAAAGDLRTVLPRQRRRAYKGRIAELTELGGPAGPALRKVIQQLRASAAASG